MADGQNTLAGKTVVKDAKGWGVELPFNELREPEGRCVGRLGV